MGTNGLSEGSETVDDSANPLGVSQATGIFSNVTSNWKPILVGLGVLALFGLGIWQKSSLVHFASRVRGLRGARLRKEEEGIRKKLREQGLIK